MFQVAYRAINHYHFTLIVFGYAKITYNFYIWYETGVCNDCATEYPKQKAPGLRALILNNFVFISFYYDPYNGS